MLNERHHRHRKTDWVVLLPLQTPHVEYSMFKLNVSKKKKVGEWADIELLLKVMIVLSIDLSVFLLSSILLFTCRNSLVKEFSNSLVLQPAFRISHFAQYSHLGCDDV